MVTINPDIPILDINERNKGGNSPKVSRGEFDAVFRQAVASTEIKVTETEATHFVSEMRPAQFTAEPLPSTNRVVDQVQRLIDTMEVYQQKLIEKGAMLKEIQPLVQKMASQSESLGETLSAMGDQETLKSIVNQSLTLASMEIAKFNNGTYNDG